MFKHTATHRHKNIVLPYQKTKAHYITSLQAHSKCFNVFISAAMYRSVVFCLKLPKKGTKLTDNSSDKRTSSCYNNMALLN